MLWVLKRTVSMRRFFWAPKTYVETDGQEKIYIFTLIFFVYLNLCFWVTILNLDLWFRSLEEMSFKDISYLEL